MSETILQNCESCGATPIVQHMTNGFKLICRTDDCKFYRQASKLNLNYDDAIDSWNALNMMRAGLIEREPDGELPEWFEDIVG